MLPTFQTEKNKLCRPTIPTYNLGRTKMEKQPRHLPKSRMKLLADTCLPPLIYVGVSLTRAVVTKYSERQQTIS